MNYELSSKFIQKPYKLHYFIVQYRYADNRNNKQYAIEYIKLQFPVLYKPEFIQEQL